MVKASASRAKDPGVESRLRRDFSAVKVGVKGEASDPVASVFKVKLIRNGILIDCRFGGLRWRGWGEGAGARYVMREFSLRLSKYFVTLSCRSGLFHLHLSIRLSSGPLGGRPRLKAGTPREAPTSAPMTNTPVPTAVNRSSTRAEATQRAPTFKTILVTSS